MNKSTHYVNGSNTTDQAYLLDWAKTGAELYCQSNELPYILEHLTRAKQRLDDIMRGYLELSARESK